jgi:pimeloyl-ACP methyl ester carboxylesterase
MLRKSFVILLALLMVAGVVSAQDGPEIPAAPGEMVDVGGYSLHIYCIGEGSPTVVIDAGLGDSSLRVRALQESISEFTQACAYDRAGYGWSDAGPEPRTSQQIVDELALLLDGAELEGPFVLVGHSFGGLNVNLFASEHPDLVAGVVLVDSSHPEQMDAMSEIPEITALDAMEMDMYATLAEQAEAGELTVDDVLPMMPEDLAEDLQADWAALFIQPKSLLAPVAEFDALDESMTQVVESDDLGDIPLIVVAHGAKNSEMIPAEVLDAYGITVEGMDTFDEIWRGLQEDLATRSTNSQLVVADQSTHYVYLMQPDIVIDAVQELVEAAQ